MILCTNWRCVVCNCGICCITWTSPQSGAHRNAMREIGARFCTALPAESDGYTGIAFGLTCAVVFAADLSSPFRARSTPTRLRYITILRHFAEIWLLMGALMPKQNNIMWKLSQIRRALIKALCPPKSRCTVRPHRLRKPGAIFPLPIRFRPGKCVDMCI